VDFGNTATFDANGNLLNAATHTNGDSVTTGNSTLFASELSGQFNTAGAAANVLTALTQASDHLPVVADYQATAVPEPSSLALLLATAGGCGGYFRRRRRLRGVTAAQLV
jgi:hypothetical protein